MMSNTDKSKQVIEGLLQHYELYKSREVRISHDLFDTVSNSSEQSRGASLQTLGHSNLPKLTCKYEIDCFDEEASKLFLLSKRIIGPKGSNMKKIIEACFENKPFESDALKLRLRGLGSGFKEGPQNLGRLSLMKNATSHCICA